MLRDGSSSSSSIMVVIIIIDSRVRNSGSGDERGRKDMDLAAGSWADWDR